MERRIPTKEEVLAYLKEDNNWGRWGSDDQVGAVNMVTDEKRAAAAKLVVKGRAVSLSREFPKTPAANNPTPALHYMRRGVRPNNGGSATDFYGISYHGQATTHLDALCHVWNGRTGCGTAATPTTSSPSTGRHLGVRRALEGGHHHPGRPAGRA